MSTAKVTIRYDGPILANHRMDVADLAPALLGLSELCKIANQKFNGDKAAVNVLIGTDVEHQCFQLDLHVVQTIWDTTKRILTHDDVGSAKNLLEWLGLVGLPAGGALGLFGLLKRIAGRKITSTVVEMSEGRDRVRITIDGDHNNVVFVHPEALELLRDEKAVANAKKVVQPVTREGYEVVEFESEQSTETILKGDAAAITNITTSNVEETELDQPQMITAWISVYSPVYDVKAPMWRFKFGDAHEYMDISETDIAHAAMKRGGAMVDDAYRVRLELRQEHKPNGSITNNYKIKEVLEFKPARVPFQTDAFRDADHPDHTG